MSLKIESYHPLQFTAVLNPYEIFEKVKFSLEEPEGGQKSSSFILLTTCLERHPITTTESAFNLSESLKFFFKNNSQPIILAFLSCKILGQYIVQFLTTGSLCSLDFLKPENSWLDDLMNLDSIPIRLAVLHDLCSIKLQLGDKCPTGLENFILNWASRLHGLADYAFDELAFHLDFEKLQNRKANFFLMHLVYGDCDLVIKSSKFPLLYFPENEIVKSFQEFFTQSKLKEALIEQSLKSYLKDPKSYGYFLELVIENLSEDEILEIFQTTRVIPTPTSTHGSHIEKWIFEGNHSELLMFLTQLLHTSLRFSKPKLLDLCIVILYENLHYDFTSQTVLSSESRQYNITVFEWLLITEQEKVLSTFECIDPSLCDSLPNDETKQLLISICSFDESLEETKPQIFTPLFFKKTKKSVREIRAYFPPLFLIGLNPLSDESLEKIASYFFDPIKKRNNLTTLLDHYDERLIPKMLYLISEGCSPTDLKVWKSLDDFRKKLGLKIVNGYRFAFAEKIISLIKREFAQAGNNVSLGLKPDLSQLLKNIMLFVDLMGETSIKRVVQSEMMICCSSILKGHASEPDSELLKSLLGKAHFLLTSQDFSLDETLNSLDLRIPHHKEGLQILNLSRYNILFIDCFLCKLREKIEAGHSFKALSKFLEKMEFITGKYLSSAARNWIKNLRCDLTVNSHKLRSQALHLTRIVISNDSTTNMIELHALKNQFIDLFDLTFDQIYLEILESQSTTLTPKALQLSPYINREYPSDVERILNLKFRILNLTSAASSTLRLIEEQSSSYSLKLSENFQALLKEVLELPSIMEFISLKERASKKFCSAQIFEEYPVEKKILEFKFFLSDIRSCMEQLDPFNLKELYEIFQTIRFLSPENLTASCPYILKSPSISEDSFELVKRSIFEKLKKIIQAVLTRSLPARLSLNDVESHTWYMQLESTIRKAIDFWKELILAKKDLDIVGSEIFTFASINLDDSRYFKAFIESSLQARKNPDCDFKQEFLSEALQLERLQIVSELCKKLFLCCKEDLAEIQEGVKFQLKDQLGLYVPSDRLQDKVLFKKIFDTKKQKAFLRNFDTLYTQKVVQLITHPFHPNTENLWNWNSEFFFDYFEKSEKLPLLDKAFIASRSCLDRLIPKLIVFSRTTHKKMLQRSKFQLDLIKAALAFYHTAEKSPESTIYFFGSFLQKLVESLESNVWRNKLSFQDLKVAFESDENLYIYLTFIRFDPRAALPLARRIFSDSQLLMLAQHWLVHGDTTAIKAFCELLNSLEIERCIIDHASSYMKDEFEEHLCEELLEHLRVLLSNDSTSQMIEASLEDFSHISPIESMANDSLKEYFLYQSIRSLFTQESIRVSKEELTSLIPTILELPSNLIKVENKIRKMIHSTNLYRIKELYENYLFQKRPNLVRIYLLMASEVSGYLIREENPLLKKIDAIYRQFL